MSMLALPETDCLEILALFRLHLPHVSDTWLQELAANYGQDAVVDIDPNDVVAILSVPGELCRIQLSLAKHEPLDEVQRRVHCELAARGVKRGQVVASLLTIVDASAKLADVGDLVGMLARDFPEDIKRGWCWYLPQSIFVEQKITCFLIVSP